MRILWLCNVIPPFIANKMGLQAAVSGGWIDGALSALTKESKYELGIAFPMRQTETLVCGEADAIRYFGFPACALPHKYETALDKHMQMILKDFQPDLVHIWGTEYPHSLAMSRAFANPQRTLVNIQGLCSIYTDHYMAHLPRHEQYKITLKEILTSNSLRQQQHKFYLRGEMEKGTLLSAGHIIGRTEWDYACAKQISPEALYYKCNETLRHTFYEKQNSWALDKCEKHSIFASQASYPIKGFHLLLQAMPEILRRYPDAKVYTTSRNPLHLPFYRQSSYTQLLKKTIIENQLQDKVIFLGSLDESAMCDRFLKSHVFVSASSIENSPNSLGEAMLLGMPCVSSYVGGAMDMLRDKEEGFLYTADAPYMMAHYICRIFEDDALAERFGKAAHAHAAQTHDIEQNKHDLLDIYHQILN